LLAGIGKYKSPGARQLDDLRAWADESRLSDELLLNPTLEQGADPPNGWHKLNSAVLDTEGFRSPRSLRLNPQGATGEWWSNRTRCLSGKLFLLRARVKGVGSANVQLVARYWSKTGAFISEEGVQANGQYGDWSEVRLVSEAPANAYEVDVRWVVTGVDTVDIKADAFSLRLLG
jgi:hypothetical protein